MKAQDDGGRGPGGSDRGVPPRYITKKSLVASAWRPPKQPDNIACFQQDRVFCLYGMTITDRPPHRAVRAPLCRRLPPWMARDEAFEGMKRRRDKDGKRGMLESSAERPG